MNIFRATQLFTFFILLNSTLLHSVELIPFENIEIRLNEISNETDEKIILCFESEKIAALEPKKTYYSYPLSHMNKTSKAYLIKNPNEKGIHLFTTTSKKIYPIQINWSQTTTSCGVAQIDLLSYQLEPCKNTEPKYGQTIIPIKQKDATINYYTQTCKTIYREQYPFDLEGAKEVSILINLFLKKENDNLIADSEILPLLKY